MTTNDATNVDVVIVGGGAAGLAAALMLGRSRRSVVVIDAGEPRNAVAGHVHGYLGREGTPPAELLAIGREEVGQYGVVVRPGRAVGADRTADGTFAVAVAGGDTVTGRRLLVATGLADELPPIPGVAERWGRDVLHCPYCHGWEVRDQPIVVISTSGMGVHQASLFRQLSDDVTLVIHAGATPTAIEREQLTSRGVRIIEAPVAEVVVADDRITGVRLHGGEVVAASAVVVAPRFVARAEVLATLGIETIEAPLGAGMMIAADATGATAMPGVFVAGNVSDVRAQVLQSAAAGAMAGAAINADLVAEDAARAVEAARARPADERPVMDEAFWDARYGSKAMVWSGNPNRHLVADIAGLAPGTALDVGAGEGADAIWLAEQGWNVTALDLSAVALARGRRRADDVGVAERITWLHADLAMWEPPARAFDLVSVQFLHVPAVERGAVYASIAGAVAPGGTLMVVGHHPSDMDAGVGRPRWPDLFFTADQIAATLGDGWTVVTADARAREITGPDGEPATICDAVLVARRRQA